MSDDKSERHDFQSLKQSINDDLEDISDFKRNEVLREISKWQTILQINPYRQDLELVDNALSDEDYVLETQLTGEGYRQVSIENEPVPDELLLKIDDTAENLHSKVKNPAFQAIKEKDHIYELEEANVLAFELGNTYDEAFEIPLDDYSNIEIEYPTQQAYQRQRILDGLKHAEQFDPDDY